MTLGVIHRVLIAAFVLAVAPVESAEINQYYLPAPVPPVALRFKALDPARTPIEEQWLVAEIAAALQARTGWPLLSVGGATADVSGLQTRLDADRSRILFEYVHMARNRAGGEWGETLSIPVSYRLERTNEVIVVRLVPAPMADFRMRATPGFPFLPGPKLRSFTELFADFAAIMESTRSLELHRTWLLSGVEETGASPAGCVEKFEAELGRYAYGRDEEQLFDPRRDDVFLFRTASDSIPLKVAAVNYRGGSKVFFQAWMPFELRADGSVAGYDLAPVLIAEVRRVLQAPRL